MTTNETDANETTANRQLLERVFAGLAAGDSRPFVDSMADRFSWTISGMTSWSRTYSGKQAVLDELFPILRARLANPIRIGPQRFLAEGDRVVVEARGENTSKSGIPYRNCYCFIFRVAGGELVELTEYMDTRLAGEVLGDP